MTWNSPVMQFTMYVVILVIVAIGGNSIVTGTMQTGELTSIIVYSLQILMSLMMVTFVFVMIMIAEASTDRIAEVLNEEPEMQDSDDAVKNVANGEIIFDHVNFSYAGKDGTLSLKDVCLHIQSGQTIGIIGGTGSAKSTLVQLIPRLYDVTGGAVKVGGVDVRNYNLEACVTRFPWFYKKMFFSPVLFMKISAGEMKVQPTKKYRMYVNWHRLTALSRNFQTATIHRLSRAVTMYPAVKNNAFVLQERWQ